MLPVTSFMPEIRRWLQHTCETGRHSLSCIAMQPRQNHQTRFFTIWTGKVPETGRTLQKRAERLCGGAAKNYYVKYNIQARSNAEEARSPIDTAF